MKPPTTPEELFNLSYLHTFRQYLGHRIAHKTGSYAPAIGVYEAKRWLKMLCENPENDTLSEDDTAKIATVLSSYQKYLYHQKAQRSDS